MRLGLLLRYAEEPGGRATARAIGSGALRTGLIGGIAV